jgi:hypothetical protein
VVVNCSGYCGKRLEKKDLKVVVLPGVEIPIITRMLGQSIGKVVRCPLCSADARARWDMDHAHMIDCPNCGTRDYASDVVVEVVG